MVVRTSSREPRQRAAKTRNSKLAGKTHGSPLWDEEEDSLLRKAVAQYGPKRWREIANMMSAQYQNRSKMACNARWVTLTNQGEAPEKRKWTPAEDAELVALVEQYDFKNWAIIASELPGRSAKQCRERWQNQVRPDLNHGPWAPSEDAVVIAWQASVGNKWATIAENLVGRTDNMVKNRWHSTLKAKAGQPEKSSTAKRKREPEPYPLRSKPKKRKRTSSSGSKKKKKKKKKKSSSRPTKKRFASQDAKKRDMVAPFAEAPVQVVESPDAVDGPFQQKLECQERFECDVGGDAVLGAEQREFADLCLTNDDRYDYWVPEGVLDEAPQLLSDYSAPWDWLDELTLSTQDHDSGCEDDTDREDDEKPCHPTAVDAFAIVRL